MANWLSSVFYQFDLSAFTFAHGLAKSGGSFLTPVMNVLAFLGKGGWAFIVLGVIFLLFKKTRRAGVCVLFALLIGAILTNVILKNAIARPRPFVDSQKYNEWWQFVGSPFEKEWSFPSGHVTATMASMTALFLTLNKKWSWVFFIFALLMGFDRIYLMVHYASDVLAGFIVGGLSAIMAYYLKRLLFNSLEKNKEKKFCSMLLEFDLIKIIKKK